MSRPDQNKKVKWEGYLEFSLIEGVTFSVGQIGALEKF